jgi:signal transduction histidine kinase/AmiR/NasT family two-component response regulator
MTAHPRYEPNWRDVAVSRIRDLPVRVGACAFVAIASLLLVGGLWPLAWLGATLTVQFATLAITAPARRDPGFEMSRGRANAFYVGLAFSALTFASIAPLLWFQGGWPGRVCSLFVLAGGAINVALQARASARQLWSGAGPFAVLTAALPIISLVQTTGAERQAMALVTVCAIMFVLHLAVAGQRCVAAARAVGQAQFEAKRAHLRAEAAAMARGDFLTVMSHELRTPLNGVLGMAQIMETDELTLRQRDRLQVVKQSGEALLMLVNDLFDIARIEDETLELEAGVVDLHQLVGQTETLFAPLAEAKKLSLRVQLMESAGTVRSGDAARVRQVLHNLVDNAIKFTETGRVGVVVSGSADELVFDITDTGPGIAPDRLATIFERFTQSDGSSSRRHGGSGLGLAITRGLVRLMGGELCVRSQVGDGSVFTVRLALPRLASAPLAAPQPQAADPGEEEGQLRIRILAAEDNHTNQLVLKTLLEQLGVTLHVVENGQEAVEAWRDGGWDLVLMDIQMPLMDGLTATRTIRRIEAAEGRIRTPIIAVTANAAASQAAEYVAAGMDGLVPKPIQFAQLLAAIYGAIEAENDNEAAGQADAASA